MENSTGGMIVRDETAGLKQVYRRAKVDPVSLAGRAKKETYILTYGTLLV